MKKIESLKIDTFIILVNYNNHQDTLICLSSIAEAGYGKNVIVVDNNSPIPGVDRIQQKFPDTILIKNKCNVGFGRANNVGIKWALENTNCKYVFILNNDTKINKDTIPLLESEIVKQDSIALATSKIVMMDNPKILWYGGGDVDWKKCSAKVPGYLDSAEASISNQSRDVTFASGCAMLVKRLVLEKVGGFDERFFMYVEDLEFCIRLNKEHYKIRYVADSVVYHKCQGSQRKGTGFYSIEDSRNPNLPFFQYNLNKNRVITVCLHASSVEFLEFLSFYPGLIVIRIFRYLIYRRFDAIKSIFNGVYDALKSLRQSK